jgi:hypothetical protein
MTAISEIPGTDGLCMIDRIEGGHIIGGLVPLSLMAVVTRSKRKNWIMIPSPKLRAVTAMMSFHHA